MFEIICNLLTLIGAIFMFVAALGLLRLRGVYLKMHSATKAGTLGCGLVLLSIGMQLKDSHGITEIILLIVFIAITNPLTAHLLGKIHYLDEQQSSKQTTSSSN